MQRNGRTAVPKFGGWDDKSGNSPSNYTVMFSEARANRKQQKKDFTRHSLGNEQELRAKQHQMEVESVRVRDFSSLSYPLLLHNNKHYPSFFASCHMNKKKEPLVLL